VLESPLINQEALLRGSDRCWPMMLVFGKDGSVIFVYAVLEADGLSISGFALFALTFVY